ncbi:MAG: DUF1926 domain-containing protein, partial [Candidatus Rokubacteria bacterium]|nr:DUF1926 domain-containing protein [Candidatus Rokubacteria bacterium]
PFADVDESVRYLESRCGRVSAITVVDDGEKFGVWPGTHGHVYGDGWLDRFFDRVLATSWLRMATFADVIDGTRATDRVYLPTASYREMGEWALATPAGRRLVAARRALAQCGDGSEFQDLLPGGFWRSFLVKYPEIGDTYWKMLRLSEALQREAGQRPGDERLDQARTQLLRGQANDAYWHGVFGGCYLPHLRRAVKQSLLAAERLLAETSAAPAVAWTRGDVNGDGREEILIRTPALAVTLNPALGGAVTELGAFEYGLDLADVLARRPETYHDRLRARTGEAGTGGGVHTIHAPPTAKEAGLEAFLEYDDLRRASLLDGLFEGEEPLDPVAPWRAARVVLGRMALAASVQAEDGGVTARFTLPAGAAAPFRVAKRVRVRDADVEARYTIGGPEAAPGGRRWAVQWNLALTAGDGAGRYFDLPGRPPLRSRGQRSDLDGVTLVDEWLGLEARLQWRPAAEVRWGPVETVSISEAGFERIYQGTAFLIVWVLPAVSSGQWEMTTALGVRPR